MNLAYVGALPPLSLPIRLQNPLNVCLSDVASPCQANTFSFVSHPYLALLFLLRLCLCCPVRDPPATCVSARSPKAHFRGSQLHRASGYRTGQHRTEQSTVTGRPTGQSWSTLCSGSSEQQAQFLLSQFTGPGPAEQRWDSSDSPGQSRMDYKAPARGFRKQDNMWRRLHFTPLCSTKC